MSIFFDTTCRVYSSYETTLDKYNRPSKEPKFIAEYPCKLSKNRSKNTINQSSPQNIAIANFTLYTVSDAYIKKGCLIEVDGMDFIASIPYKTRNILSVDVFAKEEV